MAGEWLTWCEVPTSDMGEWEVDSLTSVRSDMAILGAPYEAGASAMAGQAEAPSAIRRLETLDSWIAPDIGDLRTVKVVDCGDAEVDRLDPSKSLAKLGILAKGILKNSGCLVTLGGDHSISAVLVNALEMLHKHPVNLIHIDAHSDTWPQAGPIPNHASWVRHSIVSGVTRSVHQFGIRAMAPADDDLDVQRRTGILSDRHLKDFIRGMSTWTDPAYLSIDMDVVEPAFCPGVAYPEPGGWMPFQLLHVIERIVATGKVRGVDIVETTPSLDRNDLSVRLAHRSVLAVRRGLKRAQG